MLRNNAAVQFVVARFAGLRRGTKSSDEPLVSPFLGEMPDADETPSAGERPALDKAPTLDEAPILGEITSLDDAPCLEAPGLGEAPSLGEISGLELPNPGELPGVATAALPVAAPEVSTESTTAADSGQSEREKLIRRRWAETGIKMWSANGQGAALTIQGRADLLPAKPGASRREYDRLEFKLIAGLIVCEGVAVDPPKLRK